jgi:surface antigen
MLHRAHHNPFAGILVTLLGALALAACQGSTDVSSLRIGPIPQPGLFLDQPPPPVTVVRDGPAGELIASAAPPLVPNAAVDDVIAEPLRAWLTAVEKRQLAEASQRAADDFTLQPVAWQARDPSGAETAKGTAMAVDDVFRAVRGRICRDVRQSVAKDHEVHIDQVTLCRQDYGSGVWVWIVGEADE